MGTVDQLAPAHDAHLPILAGEDRLVARARFLEQHAVDLVVRHEQALLYAVAGLRPVKKPQALSQKEKEKEKEKEREKAQESQAKTD